MSEYKKIAKQGWNSDKKASNRKLRSFIKNQIDEQLSDTTKTGKVAPVKKNTFEKQLSRELSALRYVDKYMKRFNMTVEDLKKPSGHGEWFDRSQSRYYQEYCTLIPKLETYLERDDLSAKMKKQIIEVLGLFK